MSGHRATRKRCGDSRPESPVGYGHMSTPGCILNKLFQLPTPPLSRHQLKRLEEHRYQSAGRSLLEPLMQRYWEWLVGRVPSWIAPNLITIIGLSVNICTTLLLIFYCPTATEQCLWFLELVLQCNWGQTLIGCFFAVLLGRLCSIVHTGKLMFLEHCDLECK
uniref:Choline/ethanolamine phosphotransferase 1 n=1 Tax=Molossus molossus TaxID=27622 RepID=A0A7J8CQ03_MOLMO|nr:choline/ethanolamine phosphotransferase 1 [Molossus molossus]